MRKCIVICIFCILFLYSNSSYAYVHSYPHHLYTYHAGHVIAKLNNNDNNDNNNDNTSIKFDKNNILHLIGVILPIVFLVLMFSFFRSLLNSFYEK